MIVIISALCLVVLAIYFQNKPVVTTESNTDDVFGAPVEPIEVNGTDTLHGPKVEEVVVEVPKTTVPPQSVKLEPLPVKALVEAQEAPAKKVVPVKSKAPKKPVAKKPTVTKKPK